MSKEDLAKFDGVITAMPGGGHYTVALPNGKTVVAKLSGRMKQNKIRCIVGDTVTVGLSPYDLNHGIILYRRSNSEPPPSSASANNPGGAAPFKKKN
jgi:translation initiation factor IF-1